VSSPRSGQRDAPFSRIGHETDASTAGGADHAGLGVLDP
jgi:hypothetical protein